MNILELSTRIHQSLNSPDSPTIGVIMYWLRHNIGELNNLINTGYSIDVSDGSIDPDLGEQEGSILSKLYMIYYYSGRVRENLGAASYDPVTEVTEGGATIRLISKNSVATSYIQVRKQEQEELDNLVAFYRSNNAVPQVIDGDDVTDTWYDGVNSNVRTNS